MTKATGYSHGTLSLFSLAAKAMNRAMSDKYLPLPLTQLPPQPKLSQKGFQSHSEGACPLLPGVYEYRNWCPTHTWKSPHMRLDTWDEKLHSTRIGMSESEIMPQRRAEGPWDPDRRSGPGCPWAEEVAMRSHLDKRHCLLLEKCSWRFLI